MAFTKLQSCNRMRWTLYYRLAELSPLFNARAISAMDLFSLPLQSHMKSLIMRGKNNPSLSCTRGTGRLAVSSLSCTRGTGRLAVSYWTRHSGQVSFNPDPNLRHSPRGPQTVRCSTIALEGSLRAH